MSACRYRTSEPILRNWGPRLSTRHLRSAARLTRSYFATSGSVRSVWARLVSAIAVLPQHPRIDRSVDAQKFFGGRLGRGSGVPFLSSFDAIWVSGKTASHHESACRVSSPLGNTDHRVRLPASLVPRSRSWKNFSNAPILEQPPGVGIFRMAVYKQKGSNRWWYKFNWNGEAIRKSTKQTNKRVAG